MQITIKLTEKEKLEDFFVFKQEKIFVHKPLADYLVHLLSLKIEPTIMVVDHKGEPQCAVTVSTVTIGNSNQWCELGYEYEPDWDCILKEQKIEGNPF